MEATIAQPQLLSVPGLPGIGRVLQTLARWFQNAPLTTEELDRIGFLAAIGQQVAHPILEAADCAALHAAIDLALQDEVFYRQLDPLLTELPAPSAIAAELSRPQSPPEHFARFLEVMGPASLKPLLRGLQYVLAIVPLCPKTDADAPTTALQELIRKSTEQPLFFVYDGSLNSEEARATLCSLQFLVCFFAMGNLLFGRPKVEPWITLALAEYWEMALYSMLRYLASVPGMDISTEFVPLSDRFNLARVAEDHHRQRRAADRLFDEAAVAGVPYYSPSVVETEDD